MARRAAAVLPVGPSRPIIFGILNVTPDSFSDGGLLHGDTAAIERGVQLFAAGADIVDVGGESTRPGAERVDVAEEQRRVLPVVRELRAQGVPVSIDTLNASTAAACAELGVAIINDVSAGSADADMAGVAAQSKLLFVACHSRGTSATMNSRARYTHTIAEVRRELEYRLAALITAGVNSERILLDPGLGFSKLSEHNWALLGGLREFVALGHPVLVGASRKRFIGELLPAGADAAARDSATAVISALSAEAGAWGVRVHDVVSTKAALDVWAAINGARS